MSMSLFQPLEQRILLSAEAFNDGALASDDTTPGDEIHVSYTHEGCRCGSSPGRGSMKVEAATRSDEETSRRPTNERDGDRGTSPPDRFSRGGSGDSAGPVIPVEGPDGLLWLCREDDEGQQSICIPWFQEVKPPPGSLAGVAGPNAGPVIPVEGPDGLLWLCREDDEGQQSICIPWFQEVKVPRFGIFHPDDTRQEDRDSASSRGGDVDRNLGVQPEDQLN